MTNPARDTFSSHSGHALSVTVNVGEWVDARFYVEVVGLDQPVDDSGGAKLSPLLELAGSKAPTDFATEPGDSSAFDLIYCLHTYTIGRKPKACTRER